MMMDDFQEGRRRRMRSVKPISLIYVHDHPPPLSSPPPFFHCVPHTHGVTMQHKILMNLRPFFSWCCFKQGLFLMLCLSLSVRAKKYLFSPSAHHINIKRMGMEGGFLMGEMMMRRMSHIPKVVQIVWAGFSCASKSTCTTRSCFLAVEVLTLPRLPLLLAFLLKLLLIITHFWVWPEQPKTSGWTKNERKKEQRGNLLLSFSLSTCEVFKP